MLVTPAFAQEGEAPEAAETGTQTGLPGGEEHAGAFPPFDVSTYPSQLLWLAITFGLFYLVMSRIVVPRIGSIIENRRDRIARDLDTANRLKEEADAAIAAYEQELATARNRAGEIAQAARDEAKAQADAEREGVEKDLAARLADAEQRIAEIKRKALADVGAIAEETTSEIVRVLIGEDVDRSTVSNAVVAAGAAARTGSKA